MREHYSYSEQKYGTKARRRALRWGIGSLALRSIAGVSSHAHVNQRVRKKTWGCGAEGSRMQKERFKRLTAV